MKKIIIIIYYFYIFLLLNNIILIKFKILTLNRNFTKSEAKMSNSQSNINNNIRLININEINNNFYMNQK